MNNQEAYKLLELSDGASKEEIQAAFRKMAKKYHPDLNKDNPDAETKFKEINSAYQLLTNPNSHQQSGEYNYNTNWQTIFNEHFGNNPFGFGRAQSLQPVQLPIISISATLDFSESVLGCKKDFTIDHHLHCADCHGSGKIKLSDQCKKCNGQGSVQANVSRGNVVFMHHCSACYGTGSELKNCDSCFGKGFVTKNGAVNLEIPGGVINGNVLRNAGMMLHISVNSDPDMTLQNGDVVTILELSLLEALKGTKKSVRTIKGEMVLKIPEKIKNKDNIVVKGYGVPSVNGSHVFDIKVNYPEESSKLIEYLESLDG